MEQTTILLIGVGGYGITYVNEITARGAEHHAQVVGIVDPYADKSPAYETVLSMNAPIYNTVEEFYAEHTADLAIISTPIPLHAPQAICCMEHGSHVLCEKPVAPTMAEAQRMIDARDRTGKLLAIGFQWCYDPAMLAFHKAIQAGELGQMISAKALVLWPRDIAYYNRGTGWAGKKYDRQGNPIFDSVASNATAHYLENILWNAGSTLTDMQVETYRANPIETYDTIILKGKAGTANVTYIASHATGKGESTNPIMEYVFEKGTTRFEGCATGWELTVHMDDGSERSFGLTRNDNPAYSHKLWTVVNAIRGQGDIACTIEEGLLHGRAIADIQALVPDSTPFPAERVVKNEERYWVPGLFEELKQKFSEA